MLGLGVSSNATAACRTFHYDHDGNPYTPLKFRVACEKTYAVRTIPKYRIETQDRSRVVQHAFGIRDILNFRGQSRNASFQVFTSSR